MRRILLGIDVGTSACKVVAFSPNGEVHAKATESYEVFYPKAGWAEQNPEDWWQAVCAAIQKILQQGVEAEEIVSIGIDGQSWSAIAIDESGQVLCNTPIWMDTRAKDICERLRKIPGEDALFAINGNPVQPMYTLPKVLWYKENMAEVYKKAATILQANSFLVYRLTGKISQEPSQGYGWNCYDVRNNCWDYDMCDTLGIRRDLLPPIVACHDVVGGVTKEVAAKTGLCEGTAVVAGGLDAACGTLGAGVVAPGQTQEQGGQAGGMSICMDTCYMDKRLILGAHVVPGLWLLQGGSVGGGGALRWFEQEFGEAERRLAQQNNTNSFEELSCAADSVPPGSEELIFLPYLAGERSPIWDSKAKGVFYGVEFSKTRAHFARAVMEGVAFSLRHNLEVAEKAGATVGVLSAMGGAANSAVWTQLKADITGKTIHVPTADTATAFGAAILAGMGIGLYESFESAVQQGVSITKVYEPNIENQAVYNKCYRLYRDLYEAHKTMCEQEEES